MHPFISLGGRILLDSWWVMTTVGILACSTVAIKTLHKEIGWNKSFIITGVFILGSLFGAHLLHCLFFWEVYQKEPIQVLLFWKTGYSFLGAPMFCALLLFAFSRLNYGISFWSTADAFTLGAPLGLFFSRIGCYLKGCCWGTHIVEGHPFFGICFKLINYRFLPLHPVQLYSAAGVLLIFCLLLLIRRKYHPPGFLTGAFVFLYSGMRFALDFFRGDQQGLAHFGALSVHQLICIVLMIAAGSLLYIQTRKVIRSPTGQAIRKVRTWTYS